MATIYVEKIHERAFKSVCALIGSSFGSVLNAKLGIKLNGDKIVYGDNEFLLLSGSFSQKAETVSMTPNGASWFKGIRENATLGDLSSKWIELVSEVAKLYHKTYPVIEYAPIDGDSEIDAEDVKEKLLTTFFPNKPLEAYSVCEMSKKSGEDFYAVSMRVSLNGGTGAPVPALCKVYFKKNGENFIPIPKKLASEIENFLKNVTTETVMDAKKSLSGAAIIDTALNALSDCIEKSKAKNNFGDYLYYSEKETAISDLLRNSKHDDVVLYCNEIEVKGITHVVLKSYTFDLVENGKPRFRINVGLNDSLNMQCLDCGKMLIVSNEIRYKVGDERKSLFIDVNKGNLGLSDEQIVEILNSKHFSKHQMTISCPENVRAGANGCSRCRCATNATEFTVDGETVYKCKNCPYPEIIYTLQSGEKCFTKELVIAKDRAGDVVLAKREDVKVCPVCGRKYVGETDRCPTCLKFDLRNSASLVLAAKTYKKYREILPLSVRLFSLFKRKYCIEDEEILLFMIGNKKWIFNKLGIMKNGYLKNPVRMVR